MLFRDRYEAGRRLAEALSAYGGRTDTTVLALPRGGVPVAFEIVQVIRAPLDVFLVRKLGVPAQPELAMGAIASGGIVVINEGVRQSLHVTDSAMDEVVRRERDELQRREAAYRGDRPRPDVEGRTVILVDDGLATGSTMRAAVRAVRTQDPIGVVVAVPVAPRPTCADLEGEVDRVVCLAQPDPFGAVGQWYDDFSQTSDEEVQQLLARAARERAGRLP